ncbi:MAG: hypothetical protein J1E37_04210 [Prevotella sp.]|nr:hypothetical protein [Prevotella sp.]
MEKYIYIKLSLPGRFIDFAEPLKPEEFDNLGTTWADYIIGRWVPLNENQIEFLNQNPRASVKEVWDMKLIERNEKENVTKKRNRV